MQNDIPGIATACPLRAVLHAVAEHCLMRRASPGMEVVVLESGFGSGSGTMAIVIAVVFVAVALLVAEYSALAGLEGIVGARADN